VRSVSSHALELMVGLAALVLSTVAVLVSAYALTILAIVCGAVSFGILLGKRPADDAQAAAIDHTRAGAGGIARPNET
jgi:hypothetical protein